MISSIVKPNRQYIGSAVDLYGRKSGHLSSLKKGNHHSKKMQRHVNKYGINDLQFEVLEQVKDKSKLLIAEQSFLDLFTPYFNSNPTAGSNLGRKFGRMSAEHRSKISAANIGKKYSKESCQKRMVKMLKYTISGKLVKTYQSGLDAITQEGLRIRKFTKTNITIGGYVWLTENQPLPDFKAIQKRLVDCKSTLRKVVLQVDKSGNTINEFVGVRIAGEKTGIDHRSISQVAAGSTIRKSAGGFIWRYKGELANVA